MREVRGDYWTLLAGSPVNIEKKEKENGVMGFV
jgi:hypothetical protein